MPDAFPSPERPADMNLLTWLTVAAAFTAEQLVDVPADASVAWAVLGGIGWTAWAGALRLAFGKLALPRPAAPHWLLAAGIAMLAAAAPVALATAVAWHGLPTACGGEGTSPEALMTAGLRGAICAMLAVGITASETRFALATTLFLVVISAIVNDHQAAAAISAGYAAVAAGGLAARAARCGASGSFPSLTGLAACLVVAASVAALGGGRDACGRALVGWLPLSGGDSFTFPWARDGIGDGENLVAAKTNPQATGPVNSGVFVTSHKPSLYDLFNDLYGEPEKPQTEQRPRSFGLGPQDMPPGDQHLADSEHAGREFSTVRKARSPSRQPTTDLAARALVTVTGPAPVHLRLAVYDTFDGRTWREPSMPGAAAVACRLEHAGGDWMRWRTAPPPAPDAAPLDGHAITIGTVKTNVLPLPARADALRIDKIDRADFFRTPHADVVTLDGTETPAGTTVHTQSLPGGVDSTGPMAVAVPPAIDACAHDALPAWVGDVLDAWGLRGDAATGDWSHVARVVTEIGRRITRDDAVCPPEDCPDTLQHVLTGSLRGRPYDFAGAAAILLRGCGYRTRLVGGLHVSGNRRDLRSRRFVATADDAHVWAELLDAAGRWIPIEPTPGYHLRPPTVPWTTRLIDGLRAAAMWVRGRAASLTTTAAVLALAAALIRAGWRAGVDAATTAWWRHAVRRADGCPILATWQLLAWRAWLAGCPKRADETIRDWHRRAVPPAALGTRLMPFLSAFEQAAYGRPATPGDRRQHRRIAEATAALVTVDRLRGPANRHAAAAQPSSIRETQRWPAS